MAAGTLAMPQAGYGATTKDSSTVTAVTNPTATNPSGTNPMGTNPSGTNPSGTNPMGTNPSGTNPMGSNPTGTNPYGSQTTSSAPIPSQCHMFKPYVPEVLLSAVCSLHMTPLAAGVVPTINTACFAGQGPENTFLPTQPTAQTQGPFTRPQPMGTNTGGYGQATTQGAGGSTASKPTHANQGGYGQQPKTSKATQGGGGEPTTMATNAYGS
ncbi:MAG: hypothetical protein L6R39_006471 [Caloplaca ligustica]|nr:MAG: hypothetical protein L6R39_006471 [Caloplaca ligustica]